MPRLNLGAPRRFLYSAINREPTNDCIEWPYSKVHNGYGQINWENTMARAHRVCFEECYGVDLPSWLQVLHRCDNRACINPEHFFLGTNADNMKDRDDKGRRVQVYGMQASNTKYSTESVIQARELRKSGLTYPQITAITGIPARQVGYIVTGKHRTRG